MVENNVKQYKDRKSTVKYILAKIFIVLILLLMYAPILYLMIFSFTDSDVVGKWNGFSFETYIRLFSTNNYYSQKIWVAVGNTLLIAICSGICTTLIGTIGAIGMFYAKKRVRNVLDFMTQIPVVNAEIVIAISLAILFVTLKWERSFFTLLIGHTVLTFPFVVLSVQPKLKQMDPNLYEAALDLGATQTQALFKTVLPEIFPGIISGFMLSVTLSLDDYIITAFTRPSFASNGMVFDTLSTYVDSATKKSGLPIQLRALTTIIFIAILLVMIIINIRASRKNKNLLKKGA
jgi:spermidine/putrescine transport system permease protein